MVVDHIGGLVAPAQIVVEPEPVASRAFMKDFNNPVAGDRITPLAGHTDRQVGMPDLVKDLVVPAARVIDRCIGHNLLRKIGRHKVGVQVAGAAFPVLAGRQVGEVRISVIGLMPLKEMILLRQLQRLRLFPELVIGGEGLLVLLARVFMNDFPVSVIGFHAFFGGIVK